MTRKRKRIQFNYPQIYEGEWYEPTPQMGFMERCCDCGLIHQIDYRVSDEGKVQFRAKTAKRETAAARRQKSVRLSIAKLYGVRSD